MITKSNGRRELGLGDELIASGMARGAAARGKKIAFGRNGKIIWGPHAAIVFEGNPNVARPGQANGAVEWCDHYYGHRKYVTLAAGNRYVWNYDFRVTPGELFFRPDELKFAEDVGSGFVLIEPNVPAHKSWTVNKQWEPRRFQEVVNALVGSGTEVVQLEYPGARHHLSGVHAVSTGSAREAFAILSRAALYIGPEGGMHHAAAALGVPAVVLFGGFIPAAVMGYDMHVNLTGGATEACGSKAPCEHCRKAMQAISSDEVIEHARRIMG